ncbi:unnamed protein product [Paramecium sonneborni]|uniref:Calcineurin-like phosphoesterase domain-containing protein n=1 Tax=Paramecium sonneborni TaxID=65129 RepID=A0A8S1KPM1_9CILI|nr:unnamed protein product [Paramecium sonneborni]
MISTEKKNELKFVCLSDTHNQHPEFLEKGDVLIHCGDFTNRGEYWEIEQFNQWLDKQKQFKYKIIIAGNHDISFDKNCQKYIYCQKAEDQINILKTKENCYYLENSSVEIEGIKIWGSPYSLVYYNGSFQTTPVESKQLWDQIKEKYDIIITHGPPYSQQDFSQSEVQVNAGDKNLFKKIIEIKPQYHIFGHIHEGYGISNCQGITFINCSYLKINSRYNKPISFNMSKNQQNNN